MDAKRLYPIALAFASVLSACTGGDGGVAQAQPSPPRESEADSMRIDVDEMLGSRRAAFEATRRATLEIALEPMAVDDPMASKVGGRPYLPPGASAPRAGDGRPLFLLAQIDFARMPPLAGYPDEGMLQFFIAADDHYGADFDGPLDMRRLSRQDGFRVLYRPAPLVPASPSTVPGGAGAAYLPFDPVKPRRMRFVPTTETLSADDVRFPVVAGDGFHALAERYAHKRRLDPDAVAQALQERLLASGHKLGGYPFFTQADPRKPEDPHVLLLQLDTDEAMMWGDSGVANFFIRPDDLARRDFSRVAYNWDCY